MEGRRFANMAKAVVDMDSFIVLMKEIIAEGAKEVGPCYNPRCTSARGVLENKGFLRTQFTYRYFPWGNIFRPVKFVRNTH